MTRQELIAKAIQRTFERADAWEEHGFKVDVNNVHDVTVRMWSTDTQGKYKIIRVCLSLPIDHHDGRGAKDYLFPQLYQVEKLENE